VFLVLLELFATLVDLLAHGSVGVNLLVAPRDSLRRVEVFHIEYNRLTLPVDCVVGPLALACMLFLELE
jgi:hypothetical protein